MAKMYFGKKVKYLGTTYPANTAFEVRKEDIPDLQKAGGWLVNGTEEPIEASKVDTAEQVVEAKEMATNDDKDWTKEELIEIATSLGIEVKGNWGIKKLKEVIAQTQ